MPFSNFLQLVKGEPTDLCVELAAANVSPSPLVTELAPDPVSSFPPPALETIYTCVKSGETPDAGTRHDFTSSSHVVYNRDGASPFEMSSSVKKGQTGKANRQSNSKFQHLRDVGIEGRYLPWDATQCVCQEVYQIHEFLTIYRTAPPRHTQPEAASLPTKKYHFSQEVEFFQPPDSYPSPPDVKPYMQPASGTLDTQATKAVFPWENSRPSPVRIFDNFACQLSGEACAPECISGTGLQEAEVEAVVDSSENKVTKHSFRPYRNLWDEFTEIEEYVRAKVGSQLKSAQETGARKKLSTSDSRESLILTNFPTTDERPSLPVTPAPISRASFWGEDKTFVEEDLPSAQGVPDQTEWVCPRCGFSSTNFLIFCHRPPRCLHSVG